MLEEVVALLRCPHCGGDLELDGASLRCGAGHAFDLARQGYVSLLPGDAHTGTADSAEMVRARAAFLGAGHYAPIAAAVADAASSATGNRQGCVVDLGAGTGYYLAAVLDRAPERLGLALDVSKHALRAAARAHPRAAAAGCDVWAPLPVRDAVAAVALSVFAPRDGAELARILAPGGTLIVVSPAEHHLREAVDALDLLTVGDRKPDRLAAKLDPYFDHAGETPVELELSLGHDDIAALAAMGPSARHREAAELHARIDGLPEPFTVTASVTVATLRRR